MCRDDRIIEYIRTHWKTKEYALLLKKYEDELEIASSETKVEERYRVLILHLVGKCLVTTREIIVLCEAGYPDGAFALSRQLYEQFITICFFMAHEVDNNFNDYVEDYELNGQYQIYKYRKEYERIILGKNEEELQDELQEIKDKAHAPLPEGKRPTDYWWAGKRSFGQLVKDIEESDMFKNDLSTIERLHLFYIATNRSVHANAAGNMQRLGRNNEYHVIDTAQSITGQGTPLCFATRCMIVILLRVCQMFNMNFEYYRTHLNNLEEYYFSTWADEIETINTTELL